MCKEKAKGCISRLLALEPGQWIPVVKFIGMSDALTSNKLGVLGGKGMTASRAEVGE
jgi:hypothetical protein